MQPESSSALHPVTYGAICTSGRGLIAMGEPAAANAALRLAHLELLGGRSVQVFTQVRL